MINQKEYIQKGKGDTIILLHGLSGALSNWQSVLTFLSKNNKVIIECDHRLKNLYKRSFNYDNFISKSLTLRSKSSIEKFENAIKKKVWGKILLRSSQWNCCTTSYWFSFRMETWRCNNIISNQFFSQCQLCNL